MKELTNEVELFRELSDEEIATVRGIATTIETPAGEYIVKQGEMVSSVYVLLEGEVRVTAVMAEGDETVGRDEEMLVRLETGEVFGELSFVTGEVPNLSVVAETDVVMAAIPHEELHELLEKDASLCKRFLFAFTRLLVSRIRDTGKELVLARYFMRSS